MFGSSIGHLSPVLPIVSVSKMKLDGPKLHGMPNRTPDGNGRPSMPTKVLLSEAIILGARPDGCKIDLVYSTTV